MQAATEIEGSHQGGVGGALIQWVGHWYSGLGIDTVGRALVQWVGHVDKASSVAVGGGLRGKKSPPFPTLFSLLPQVWPFMEQFSKGSSVECF